MSLSSACDLHARDGKHAASKVLVLGCTVAAFVLLVIAFLKSYAWTWPAVAAFVGFLWAPFAQDVIKALAKIRQAKGPQ